MGPVRSISSCHRFVLRCGALSCLALLTVPFNKGTDDGKVRLWTIPLEGISEDISEPPVVFTGKKASR